MNAPSFFRDACRIVSPDYRVEALARANAAILRGTRGCGTPGPGRSAKYEAPADPPRSCVSAKVLADNTASLARYVSGAINTADTMAPERARDHLYARAQRLHDYLGVISGCGEVPAHLIGLDAWAISDARDTLTSEAIRRVSTQGVG